MKTLYVSDLDGTLLDGDCCLSQETIETVNGWIDAGGLFTVATARSWDSAEAILRPLRLRLPVVLMNGVFIYDPLRQTYLKSNLLERQTALELIAALEQFGLNPLVYTIDGRGEFHIDYKGLFNPSETGYVMSRLNNGDRRFREVPELKLAEDERVMEINVIGTEAELAEARRLHGGRRDVMCHYSPDIYTPGYCWMEFNHAAAHKGDAVAWVKKRIGADRMVCFGDNLNDLSMFEAADAAYATANAHPELRDCAVAVIGSHLEHGVARFLQAEIRSQLRKSFEAPLNGRLENSNPSV